MPCVASVSVISAPASIGDNCRHADRASRRLATVVHVTARCLTPLWRAERTALIADRPGLVLDVDRAMVAVARPGAALRPA